MAVLTPLSDLEARIGHVFAKPALLEQAVTHRSHSARHNERLEFLGDGVLNFVVAALLFERYPKLPEGDLSRLRANLVKQATLAHIAQTLQLSPYLRLGEGELKSGGFRRPSILADTLEALLGAVFLDAGFIAARGVIVKLYAPILAHIDPETLGKDAKTLLQEFLQGRQLALPVYTVIATHGAAHDQQFEVECLVAAPVEMRVVAAGTSRRAAEQIAAGQVLETLLKLPETVTGRARKSAKSKAKTAQLSLPVAVAQKAS